MKTCTKCGETKPLTDFYANKDRRNGYYFECKECIKAYHQARRDAKRVSTPLVIEYPPLTKACRVCGKEKSLKDFQPGKAYKFGRRHICIECHQDELRIWNKNHSDRSGRCKPEAKRNSNLKQMYGISLDEVSRIKDGQKDACAICGEIPSKGLVVDHDHTTGVVRGLLCARCNIGLGYIESFLTRGTMARALSYIDVTVEQACSA